MKKNFLLIFIIFLSFNGFATKIELQGPIPAGISSIKLQEEYHRIRKIIQPSFSTESKPITILFYSKKDSRKSGIRLPEWGGGGALGQDSIVIPVDKQYAFYDGDFYRILLHELTHIALARSYGNIRLPRWFHEGIAMSLSGEVSFDESVILSQAILTGSLISFDSIEYVNRYDAYRASIAYGISHYAVQFMNNLYGYEMLPELLDSAKNVRRFDTACVRVFGLTVREFEAIVKNDMTRKYRFIFLFSDYGFIWIFILILAIAGFTVTIVRNRKRRKQLAIEEEMDNNIPELSTGGLSDVMEQEQGNTSDISDIDSSRRE